LTRLLRDSTDYQKRSARPTDPQVLPRAEFLNPNELRVNVDYTWKLW